MIKTLGRAALLAAVIGMPVSAHAVTQDLNSFATNTAINSLGFGGGITATVTTVSNRSGGTNQAVTFDSDNPTGNDDDLGPFTPGQGQILIIAGPENGSQGLPDDDAQGGTITFDFNQAVNLLSFVYIDTESPNNELLLSASNGFSIGNGSGLVTGNFARDTFNAGGALDNITSISFIFEGSGAIDDFNVTAVPLPLPGVLLGGVLLAGYGLSRRRKA